MLNYCNSSMSEIDDKTGHVGIPFDIQFLPYSVPANLDSPHRNIHQWGNFLGGYVQSKISAQTEFLWGKIWEGNLQSVQEIFVHFIKS